MSAYVAGKIDISHKNSFFFVWVGSKSDTSNTQTHLAADRGQPLNQTYWPVHTTGSNWQTQWQRCRAAPPPQAKPAMRSIPFTVVGVLRPGRHHSPGRNPQTWSFEFNNRGRPPLGFHWRTPSSATPHPCPASTIAPPSLLANKSQPWWNHKHLFNP